MMVTREVIEVIIVSDVDIGLNIPAAISLAILKKLLMVIGDVDIYPRPATLTPVT